jgi:hypothetical protein
LPLFPQVFRNSPLYTPAFSTPANIGQRGSDKPERPGNTRGKEQIENYFNHNHGQLPALDR